MEPKRVSTYRRACPDCGQDSVLLMQRPFVVPKLDWFGRPVRVISSRTPCDSTLALDRQAWQSARRHALLRGPAHPFPLLARHQP